MAANRTGGQQSLALLNITSPNDPFCEYLDDTIEVQNSLYWKHKGSGTTNQMIAFYALVCSFGSLANLFVICCVLRLPHLRNLRNYFIVNLAVSDLLMCTVTAPATLYLTLNLFWPFGDFTCQLVACIQAVNTFVSCLTLVAIAMDRFLLMLFPTKWGFQPTMAPLGFYAVVWVLSLCVAAPYFFAVSAEDVSFWRWNHTEIERALLACERQKPQICVENSWSHLPFSRKTYTLTVLGFQYLMPLAALALSYCHIGTRIRRRLRTGAASRTLDTQRRQAMTNKNRKAFLLLTGLVFVYAVCWLPVNLYNTLNVLDFFHFSQYKYIYCHLVGMTSACLNPVLYGVLNENFRVAFATLIRPCRRCCRCPAADTTQSQFHSNYNYSYTTAANTRSPKNCGLTPMAPMDDAHANVTQRLCAAANGAIISPALPAPTRAAIAQEYEDDML
uniref:G-protein coupled receptors family 1 profile domain-containing protein n=1 Tax=Plectus sambesii TaxID=2011161 RepID=A0A914VTS2_9BILA